MQFFVDFISIPSTLLEDHQEALQARIKFLSHKDLASLLKIADQLWLKEPYLTNLEQILIPICTDSEFIKAFAHDQSVQKIISSCNNLDWKNLLTRPLITDPLMILNDFDTSKYQSTCEQLFKYKRSFSFSPNRKFLTTESYHDSTVEVTEISTKKVVCLINSPGYLSSVNFSPNEKYVTAEFGDGTAHIIDIKTNQIIRTFNAIHSFAFSPDEKHLTTQSQDKKTVRVTDIESGEIIQTIHCTDNVNPITFSPDGKYFAHYDNTVQVTEITTGQTLCTVNDTDSVYFIAFSADGKYLAIASENDEDNTDTDTESDDDYFNTKVKIIDIKSSKIISSLIIIDANSEMDSIVFSSNGKLVAISHSLFSTGFSSSIQIHEVATSTCLLNCHNSRGKAKIAFSADEKFLLVNDNHIPIQQYDLMQSALINSLKTQPPRLSFKELSPEMQQLLLTLREDLQTQLVTDAPQQKDAAQPMDFDQIDDNPIPLKDRCPSGEHNTKESCCGCTSENSEHTHKKIKR